MLSSLMAFQIGVILTAFMVGLISSVSGQVSTSCTTSMMNSITPCANIITGSTNNNGLKPPSTCCDSLRSLMNTNTNCACFLLSANAPFFQLPLTLALSFSQACNINGLPLQCKGLHHKLSFPIFISHYQITFLILFFSQLLLLLYQLQVFCIFPDYQNLYLPWFLNIYYFLLGPAVLPSNGPTLSPLSPPGS